MKIRDKLLLCAAVVGLLGVMPGAARRRQDHAHGRRLRKASSTCRPSSPKSLGYFKEEGLDVQILNEGAGVDAENEMLAGAVQGVVGFYDHCVDLQTKGKFVESIVQLARRRARSSWCRASIPQIKSHGRPARARRLGVTGPGLVDQLPDPVS